MKTRGEGAQPVSTLVAPVLPTLRSISWEAPAVKGDRAGGA